MGKNTKQTYCAKKYNTSFGFNDIMLRIDAIKACELALLLTSVHPGVITFFFRYQDAAFKLQLINENNFLQLYEKKTFWFGTNLISLRNMHMMLKMNSVIHFRFLFKLTFK